MQFEIRGHEMATLLDRLPDGVTTLSLDCFDTLIWRCVQTPRDVFAALDLPGGGIEPRFWAEGGSRRMALNRHGTGEVTLPDIYRRLWPNADDARIDAAVAAELAAEQDHMFAFAPTIALMRDARRRGLGIVLVSDMYLTEAEIRRLIEKAAGADVLALIDRIFVSSEHGCSKASGLLEKMLKAMRLAPAQVLHVGDNPDADLHPALKLGIHAAHFRQFDDAADRRLRLEAAVGGMIHPEMRVTRPVLQFHRADVSLRQDDDPVAALGHDVIGPALQHFALWLKSEIDALAARLGRPVRPLFVMRDGYLPWRVFDLLYPEAQARTVEISRFAAARACLHDRAAIEDYLIEWLDRLPIGTLVKQLGLHGHEVSRHITGKSDRAARIALADAVLKGGLWKQILQRSEKFGDKLLAHLRAADVAEGDAVMLVDIGYNGTVQNILTPMLAKRMGLTVAGRYMFLREEQYAELDKAGMLDISLYETRTLHAMATCVAVIEQLCNISQGSTVDYEADGTPIRESLDVKSHQNEARLRVQAAALASVAAAGLGVHRAPAVDTIEARRHAAAAILARLFFMPSAEEVAIFETFDQDVNMGTSLSQRLLDPQTAANGLRTHGLAYVNNVMRMYIPAEIQRHGLQLNLSHLSSLRFSLDLRNSDFAVGGVPLPVIVADATEQSLIAVTATPTANGYYRATVPVGQGRLTAAFQLGRLCDVVQIDGARFFRVTPCAPGEEDLGQPAQLLTDGMTMLAEDLHQCGPNGLAVVMPPTGFTEPMMLTLVFRPIRWRGEAATQVLAA